MVDDRESKDDTIKQTPADTDVASAETALAAASAATVLATAGIGDAVAVGSAQTIAAPTLTPTPLPPPPSVSLATRPLGRRSKRDSAGPELEGSRYTFGSLIGEGGMGEVVAAYDEQIGREVAVKRIRAETPGVDELSRFLREARVQGRLEHPAVVPVHDLLIDEGGRPFFVMKRLAGTVMSEVLHRMRAGEEPDEVAARRRLLRAFADVCLAVEFAHSRGIIHRDLKPANIMLGEYGEVYVLDWGVARAVQDGDDSGAAPSGRHDLGLDSGETRAGTVLGTPAYMAPEQLLGERAGPAADIYALGCMLYEIAAGEALHSRARSFGSAMTPVDAKPSRKRPDSPPELDTICERATQVEPTDRYTTARAIGDAVQRYLDGDRDVAVRKELAQQHVSRAREALARGDGEEHRRDAMSAAGRALALDPTAFEAAELVTRLILQPPTKIPAEVEEHIAAIDTNTARTQGRLAALSMLGYFAFLPFLLWTGIRDATLLPVFLGAAAISGLQVWWLTQKDRISAPGIYANACINAVLIGVVCRMVGPFVIAPTLVVTTLMAYAAHPQFGRMRVMSVILALGVAVPWVLEAAGVIAPTYRFENGSIILTSPMLELNPIAIELAFAALLVALVAIVALLSRGLAVRQREATSRLELQSWHLRQIVPTGTR